MSEVEQLEASPESPEGLVTTAEARIYLQKQEDDKPTVGLLEQVINGLSLRIVQRTGRTYINSDTNDKATTRLFNFDPSDRWVDIDDCRGLTKVEVSARPDDTDSWVESEADQWIAEPLGEAVVNRLRFFNPDGLPAQGRGWGLLGLHASNASVQSESTLWPHQVRAELQARAFVRVTAKWGYGPDNTTVPANVKLAVLMWLQNIHKRDQAFFGKEANKVIATLAMPKDVEELLDGEAASRPSVTAI